MSRASKSSVPMQYRKARWAVSALFWLNGATMASMLPRYPLIKDNLELSATYFGLAVGVAPLGGLITGLAASKLIRRFASAKVATWAQIVQIICSLVVMNAPHAFVFALGLFLMSATDVYTDIAMNAHGLRVQKHYPRSINNSFHGFWSIGAFAGGLLGSAFAGMHLSLLAHSLISAAIMLTINISIRPLLLKGPDTEIADEVGEEPKQKVRIPKAALVNLVALGLIAAFAAEIEDAGFTWSAIYLRENLGAAPAVAGLGLSALVGAQTIGRFTGDRLVDALGDRNTARLACGLATVAMVVALCFPSTWLVIAGMAVAGWGVATIVPAAYVAGNNMPGLPHGAGLTVVNWMLRLAFVMGPPIVGRLGDLVGLRWALMVMPLSTLMVVLLSGYLSDKPPAKTA